MIDFTLEEILELARQAELQKRVEADGVKVPEPQPVILPEVCVASSVRQKKS